MPFTVRLKNDLFTKAVRLAGFRSDYALAKKMGINRSTVARVLSGDLNPGPAFIAGALTALTPMQFDDLFEVVGTDQNVDMDDDAKPASHRSRPAA
jgi:transcriptional regulator with XRE-family HTH domain